MPCSGKGGRHNRLRLWDQLEYQPSPNQSQQDRGIPGRGRVRALLRGGFDIAFHAVCTVAMTDFTRTCTMKLTKDG